MVRETATGMLRMRESTAGTNAAFGLTLTTESTGEAERCGSSGCDECEESNGCAHRYQMDDCRIRNWLEEEVKKELREKEKKKTRGTGAVRTVR